MTSSFTRPSRRSVMAGLALASAAGFAPAIATARTQSAGAATPDINLSPRRLVVPDGARAAEQVVLFNRGGAGATYAIELVDLAMNEEGRLVAMSENPASAARVRSAASMIRYSPRRVTLAPGESQVVRIQVRRPTDLAPGEYRTHFTVSALPPEDTGLAIEEAVAATASGEIRIQLTTVYGVSIPLIVREGELTARASISAVAPARIENRPAIALTIDRSGDRSIYGDLTVALDDGSDRVIAQLRGVGVYPEVDRRHVVVELAADAPALAPGARVKVSYVDQDHDKGAVLAATTAVL